VKGWTNVELTPVDCGLLADWIEPVLRGWIAHNDQRPTLEGMTVAAGGYDDDLVGAMRRRASGGAVTDRPRKGAS